MKGRLGMLGDSCLEGVAGGGGSEEALSEEAKFEGSTLPPDRQVESSASSKAI